MTQRREVIKAMGITAIAGLCGVYPRITAAQTPKTSDGTTTPYTVPPLPYAYDALEPYIDAQTMHFHHDKHHAAYVKNLNAALADHPDLAKLPVDELVKHLDRVLRNDPHRRAQQWRRTCEPFFPVASHAEDPPRPTESRIGESHRRAIRQLLRISRTVHEGCHERIWQRLGLAESR